MLIGHENTAVELIGITKYFPGTIANYKVNLTVRKGEVLALLGENGAGKSTLMKVLYGMYMPDEGEIRVDGKKVDIRSPQDALALGIGMIHQHFTLVPVHTVVENVLLSAFNTPKGKLPVSEAAKEIEEIGRKYGLEVDPYALVNQLTVGMQQRVEILKALYAGARILIMDEPTAVLTPQNAQKLFEFVQDFRQAGNSVVFITHKLNEVMEIADRIVVMRGGKVTGELPREAASENELARMMVGKDLDEITVTNVSEGDSFGNIVLSIRNLRVKSARGHMAVDGLSLDIREGEIFGIAGVSGNGQEELAEALCGLRKIDGGEILLESKNIVGKKVMEIIKEGIGYIPADRHREGLVLDMSLEENLILRKFESESFSARGVLIQENIRRYAERAIDEYAIKTPSSKVKVRGLSGGNQQKVVVAREMDIATTALVAVQPTRGLDLGAIDYVHRTLLKAKAEGKAILLISTELSEILALSDRVGVIYRGKIVKVFNRQEAKVDEIGLAMMGVSNDEAQ
ncbi:ABC transporter ATP-binding protein [Thermovirga sp.]|uniref:ABC transporter ATP-binding protein n=1 Tax=Thermovirga sp. TaxID=2699834 RepID=UPI0025F6C688|nr:ABC transporter ATP-binding protein [Thermovirga sp.]MBO8153815.1 ABC transporter ATP-binding protein [Thermovirga sp.]